MKISTVTQARDIVLQKSVLAKIVAVNLHDCCKKILAENVIAHRDQPAADRSAVDGIALSHRSWQNGCETFFIKGIQKAGIAPKKLVEENHCFEIMTGAVIPKNCDCVVPIEDVKIIDGFASFKTGLKILQGQFIRKKASEYKKNTLLISSGTKVKSTHIAVCAASGKAKLKVFLPRIALIGTGDELISVEKKPKLYQDRRSNTSALEALLCSHGFTSVKKFHFKDNLSDIKKNLLRILKEFDVVILSGGVSMGKFDFIPQALKGLDIKIVFHKVSQKPGKPLLFAKTQKGQAIFGLPGNPVSTFVCAVYYVVPYLYKMCASQIKTSFVKLAGPIRQNQDLTLFVPVTFDAKGFALPVRLSSSGHYSALVDSEGFVEIPQGKGSFKKNSEAKFFSW